MASNEKIIDIDPIKRLTKEYVEEIKKEINELDPANVDSVFIFVQRKEDHGPTVLLSGLSCAALLALQCVMDDLRHGLVYGPGGDSE